MKAPALLDAVIPPGSARELAAGDNAHGRARRLVTNARNEGRGIYNPVHPLVLLPFEIRFLSRAAPPDRWVIDLSKGDDRLVEPERYYEIARLEESAVHPRRVRAVVRARQLEGRGRVRSGGATRRARARSASRASTTHAVKSEMQAGYNIVAKGRTRGLTNVVWECGHAGRAWDHLARLYLHSQAG